MKKKMPGDEATSKVTTQVGRQPMAGAPGGSIPPPGHEPTGWEICPLKGKPHADHDAAIRKVTARLATALKEVEAIRNIANNNIARVAQLQKADQDKRDNGYEDLSSRLDEFEREFKATEHTRTSRLLAERLFEVERQNDKLRSIIRERGK